MGLIVGIFSGLWRDAKLPKMQKICIFERTLRSFLSRVHCLSKMFERHVTSLKDVQSLKRTLILLTSLMQWYIKIRMHCNKLVCTVDYIGVSIATDPPSAHHRYGSLNVYPHPHPASNCSQQWWGVLAALPWLWSSWSLSHPRCSPFPPHEQGLVVVVGGAVVVLAAMWSPTSSSSRNYGKEQ